VGPYWNMTSGVRSNSSSATSCDAPCDLTPRHNSHHTIPQDKPSPQVQDPTTNLQGMTKQDHPTPATSLTHKYQTI